MGSAHAPLVGKNSALVNLRRSRPVRLQSGCRIHRRLGSARTHLVGKKRQHECSGTFEMKGYSGSVSLPSRASVLKMKGSASVERLQWERLAPVMGKVGAPRSRHEQDVCAQSCERECLAPALNPVHCPYLDRQYSSLCLPMPKALHKPVSDYSTHTINHEPGPIIST